MNSHSGQQASRVKRDGGISAFAIGGLCLLLVVPAYALSRFAASVDWRILAGVPAVTSVFAFLGYRSDKRLAEAGEWRIPETILHLADIIGGWPGGFLAQRIFRHKTSKTSFQIVFWLVVMLHEFLAVDSLLGWRFTNELLDFAKHHRTQ